MRLIRNLRAQGWETKRPHAVPKNKTDVRVSNVTLGQHSFALHVLVEYELTEPKRLTHRFLVE